MTIDELQKPFDLVLRRLRKQGHASTLGGTCRYRSPDGSRCAIGHLIPDQKYRREFEFNFASCSTRGREIREAAGLDPWNDRHTRFAAALQDAHDEPSNMDDRGWLRVFESRMRLVAQKFGLKYTPPKEAL